MTQQHGTPQTTAAAKEGAAAEATAAKADAPGGLAPTAEVSVVNRHPPEPAVIHTSEERIAVATQWQLMWWRSRKHKLALGGTIVLAAVASCYRGTLVTAFFPITCPWPAACTAQADGR